MAVAQESVSAWSIASRALAAIVGGYGLISLATAALTLLLPRLSSMTLFDAVLAATMPSFLLWAIVGMAVFYARTALRAWVGLALTAAPLAVVFIYLRMSAAP